MTYKSLKACVDDLERHGMLLRIKEEVNPDLEMADIHLRIHAEQGPAILFEKVKGSPFPALSNLYGTKERVDFIFRKTLDKVTKVIDLKTNPALFFKHPFQYSSAPFTALTALPKKIRGKAPSLWGKTTIDRLPQIKSWKKDGGAFITLPQVLSMPPDNDNIMDSNIGMYRIQLSGNEYIPNEEIGLHYQIHRGIGIHHTMYNKADKPFRVAIFVGGPPSHTFSAIMPLPEGLTEMTFSGMLGGRRFRYKKHNGYYISSDADFVITGIIEKDKLKPEGPFGDHLGYYSLKHDFPVMKVEQVYHRKDAIWHFTVVGRPPQEDSLFGYLIHRLTQNILTAEFPGVRQINAVDAAGVHPLLLVIGSERYMPFREKKPEEILTQANRILGSGQTSLAKFLFIAAGNDHPKLDAADIPAFFRHILERIDWRRDLHFITKTTIDTLDYSGSGWNAGSKVIFACYGEPVRELKTTLPADFSLPGGFSNPKFVEAGILAIEAPTFSKPEAAMTDIEVLSKHLEGMDMKSIPLIVLVDDSNFVTESLNNFLWVTFTRANPSHDIHGVDSAIVHKHWGCKGSLIIDSRIKPHHAPVLMR